jgi:4-amino-4-deoxy-L-arabinose transferase-like glycosyltransferase
MVLASIVCLGMTVRVRQYFAMPSFWCDEAFVVVNVVDKTYGELAGPLRCHQAAPLLFLWSLRWLYLCAGANELAMRLPALLAGLASLLVFIPLARQTAGRPGGLWAVAFCALSAHAVNHSVEVKPYALDLLMSSLLLWAASGVLRAEPGMAAWRWSWLGLMGGSLVGPWLSYPSLFILGGASLALAIDAWSRKIRWYWYGWGGLNAVTLLSVATVWLTTIRYQRTSHLVDCWQFAFLDLSSVGAAFLWVVNYVVKVGNYASTGLGIPLALLGFVGLVELWRQSRPLVLLLVGPLGIALVPNSLRLYPLDDRLLFFAAPCLWLIAAAGISVVLKQFRGRAGWVGVLALAALVLPAAVLSARNLVVVEPKVDYRTAFDFVLREQESGDLWWVPQAEVAEAYFGRAGAGLSYQTPEAIAQAAHGKRLWIVTDLPPKGPLIEPEQTRQLEIAGLTLRARKDWKTVSVLLYAPSP